MGAAIAKQRRGFASNKGHGMRPCQARAREDAVERRHLVRERAVRVGLQLREEVGEAREAHAAEREAEARELRIKNKDLVREAGRLSETVNARSQSLEELRLTRNALGDRGVSALSKSESGVPAMTSRARTCPARGASYCRARSGKVCPVRSTRAS